MTTNALPSMLVIGASGMLGAPVTAALVRNGFKVSALARGNAPSSKPGLESVRNLVGDVFDHASLENAMTGIDGVYINLGTPLNAKESDRLTEREGLANVLAAAAKTRVKRVAMISPLFKEYQGTADYDWWQLRVKAAAEKAVMEGPVPWTIYRASSFFENLQAGMRRGNNISIMGRHWRPQRYLAAADYAELVAKSLASESSAKRVLFAQGPEAMTLEALAKRYVAARTKEKLSVQKAPLGVMKFIGLFAKDLGTVAKMMEALDGYAETFQAQSTWDAFGQPKMTVEDFAARA